MTARMLLVEDNEDDVELTLRACQKAGLERELLVVRDGAEAIEYLFCTGRHASRPDDVLPDVVLLDLKLPQMSGHEVLRRIRADERTKLLPVVILSSSSADKDVVESYRLGANSYVQKPVNFDDFLEAARQLALYWLSLNRHLPPGRPG
jgi:two-component system response regulator